MCSATVQRIKRRDAILSGWQGASRYRAPQTELWEQAVRTNCFAAAPINRWNLWRARRDSNSRPLASEGDFTQAASW